MIHELQVELAEEADDHAKSEHALQQLEARIEDLQLELERKVNHVARIVEENESLTNKLQDTEQVTRELENTIKEKSHVISHLKDQVKLSQNETSKRHETQSILAPPGTPLSSSLQTGTLPGISHLDTFLLSTQEDTNKAKVSEINYNLPSNNTSPGSSISDNLAAPSIPSSSGTKASNSQPPVTSPRYRKNCEKCCQNCKNEVPEDLDIEIPSPVYFYDFLSECPSPWLHYGYCRPCLEVARHTDRTQITQHIAECPAFIDQCWDGEHESLIAHYEKTESENLKYDQNDNIPPSSISTHMHSSKSESNAPSPCSNHSSPSPYFRTNPDEYCQNCKNEISAVVVQLPCPVQYFDFITECPSPWLHYGYCTPCLENARLKGTKIITEHITQCEALYGQCWENEHENHILHYQHTEAKNI